jgi:hypothetical protein
MNAHVWVNDERRRSVMFIDAETEATLAPLGAACK